MELLSLKGGYTGSFESTLVKVPHCWKSGSANRIGDRRIVTLNVLMDSSSWLDTIYFGWSIVYIEGSRVNSK